MKVVLDTNFLALPAQFKIDIFADIRKMVPGAEFVALEQVISELENIDDRVAKKIGLQLIKKYKVQIKREAGKTDDAIFAYAKKNKAVVCTNDRKLKKKCKHEKIPVIFMRKKKILVMG